MSETVNQENATNNTQEPKTFTQEEVNGIVNDRLARERKKYEGIDLEALKSKAAKFDKLEEESKTELQKATERAEKLQAELDGIKKANEVKSIREKVAEEMAIPVSLLTADTEEECREQASAINAFAKPSAYPQVRDGGEPRNLNKNATRDDFAKWAQQVNM